MNDNPFDELGPVDYLVVEFPGGFTGELAPILLDLVDREIVRVLDLVMIRKATDGSYEAAEISDLGESDAGEFLRLETEMAEVLSAEDVANAAEALEPGSSAALLVYENRWAAPFAAALRHSGGQLVASGRIPTQELIAALEEQLMEGV